MHVMILGCGPAGLLAAHGVRTAYAGAKITIFSRKVKSPMYGAQYLHEPIPGTPSEVKGSRRVTYDLKGSVSDYRIKVYGPLWDGKVSPEDLLGEHDAWDIRATYDWLWDEYEECIVDANVTPADLGILSVSLNVPGLIINSIPRTALCTKPGEHHFGSTMIIAAGDAPGLGIRLPYQCADEHVVCNGDDNPSWYRMSRVFGHTTVEWPMDVGRVPITSAASVQKPTTTNCDCWPAVQHVGRYGRWEKGVLSHTAFRDAMDMVIGHLS